VVARVHGGAGPRRRAGLTEPASPRTVSLAEAVVRVVTLGSGPPVLLLHGSGPGTTAWGAWRPLGETLADRFTLVAPDQAGFGGTPLPPGRPPGRALWTEQAIALMDLLGHERYAVIGHSMGGAVALSVAAARPDAVGAVVGIGCMGAAMPLPRALDRLWAARATRESAREVLGLIAADPEAALDPSAVETRLAAMRAQEGYDRLFPPPRERWVADLTVREPVRAPVLLVHGEEDRIVPRDAAVALVAQLDDVRLRVIEGSGHSPHADRPGEVLPLIASFLEDHA
jgi:2-hydroxymuconate-semialdehyde hydrolase